MSKNEKTYLSEILDEKGFLNGVYIPWLHAKWFGRDIGPNTLLGLECAFNEAFIRKTFYNSKAMGFQMGKIWLCESREGMEFDDKGSVIGVNSVFMKNLERLLQIANEVDFPISFCLYNHNQGGFEGEKLQYDKYSRYMQVECETEKFIENYINPIVKLGRKYGVILFDLFAEPEAESGVWQVPCGVSWQTMTRFINRMGKAVKDIDPRLATTVSSGANECGMVINGFYSNIEVDYYGADIYSNSGSFSSTEDMLIEKPFMPGEYGLNDYGNKPDSVQIQAFKNFFNSCDKYRVAGGFYWCYGWAGGGEMHIVNLDGELRETAAFLRFYEADRESKRTGKVCRDEPRMIITDSTDNIQWFGSRGATEYSLECKSENGWSEVARVKAEPYEEFPAIVHSAYPDSPERADYRVTAYFADGSEIVSQELTLDKKVTY